jgi:predicted amino acid-binding ACT domain protein
MDVLNEHSWFFNFENKYITKKMLTINNLTSIDLLNQLIDKLKIKHDFDVVFVSDYEKESLSFFNLLMDNTSVGYYYSIPYFVSILNTKTPFIFNVSSDCCNPIPGDEIFGFVTIGEGVKIHRTNCSNALSLMSNYGYRIIKAKWADDSFNKGKAFLTSIKVAGIDSVGIVSIITDIISKQLKINMRSISISSNEGMFEGSVFLEVHDTQQLENIMKAIKAASPLISVSRVDLN